MNLRQKTILTILATFVSVMGVGAVLSNIFFLESFRDLEMDEINNEGEGFHYLLESQLEELDVLTADWAVWDDTFDFIDTADPAYIESNLVDSTFQDLGLRYVVYIDSQSQTIYEACYDQFEQEFQDIENSAKEFFLSLAEKAHDSIIRGFYSDNGQLVLFSANPILTSERTGPSRGVLIFMRPFDGKIANHLAASLASQFTIYPASSINFGNFNGQNENQNFPFDDSNRDTVRFASFIRDIEENDIFEVEFVLPRTIYKRGLNSMRELLLSVGSVGLLASLISIFALEKGFLSRLSQITEGIRTYEGGNGKSAQMILVPGKDELSKLSTDIHTALVNLTQARDDLSDHLELEKLLVTISAKFINLPLNKIDDAICQVLEAIGKFAGVDRSYLMMMRENDPFTMENTHEWCSSGTSSVKNKMQNVDLGDYIWWHGRMKSGKSLFIDDIQDLPLAAADEKETFSTQSVQSIANIPLFVDGKLAGSLGFDAVKEKIHWSEEINILLEVVGGILTNALDRQRHETDLSESRLLHQRRSQELDALRDTIADITSELEIKKLLQTILERAIKLLSADGGDFCVVEEQENAMKVVAIVNMNKRYLNTLCELGEGAAGKAALKRETVILEDYSSWDEKIDEYSDASIHSAMVTPLIIGDRLLGTVGIFHYGPEKRFVKEDQHLLSLFAQHAAIALDNAMLFEKIQELARIDEVTGLLNRRSFSERAEYELNRAKRLKNSLAFAMIDLDNFKQVNDRFSHQIGDQVLKEVSQILQSNIRNIDIIGRYGGDEAVILMPETNENNALLMLERLKGLLAEQDFISTDKSFRITASIGLSVFPGSGVTLEQMISTADAAMYRAKNNGKNRVSL